MNKFLIVLSTFALAAANALHAQAPVANPADVGTIAFDRD